MTADQATELCRAALQLALIISLPILATAMLVGLLISVLQAVTQLQEQTLSFVPKLVAMALVLLFTLPWMLGMLSEYSITLFENIPRSL